MPCLRVAVATIASVSLIGCNIILGAGDYKVGHGGSASSSGGSTTNGGTGTTAGVTASATASSGSSMTSTSSSGSSSSSTSTGVMPSISIYPTFVTLGASGTQQFSVTVGGLATSDVKWMGSSGLISQTGAYTAPTAPGMYTVTATSAVDPTLSATATVTVTANAPTYGLTLPPAAHPRIFWTDPTRVQAAKTWWASNSYAPSSNTDNGALMDSLFGYVASGGNAQYCQVPINTVLAISPTVCGPADYGCDEGRDFGEVAVLTYDWCFPVLTAAQQAQLRANIDSWFSAEEQEAWGGVGTSPIEYYAANVRNELEWGIASYPEDATTADAFLKDALTTRYAKDFLPASITEMAGGISGEGSDWGIAQPATMAMAAFPTAEALGRDVWNETPYWKGAVLTQIYMTPPLPTMGARAGWDIFPFGDDGQWALGQAASNSDIGNFMTVAANQWRSTNIGQLARTWLLKVHPNVDNPIAATDANGGAPGLPFSILPNDYYASGTKSLLGRSDWSDTATAYFFQMGVHNTNHDHSDWGNFQIHRKGRWLTRETPAVYEQVPGYGGVGLESADLELAHNVALIDGKGPRDASSNIVNGTAVNRLESAPLFAYADADLTNVYRFDAQSNTGNIAALHVEREYVFLRDVETFVILDRLEADAATRSRSFVVHCETSPMAVDATHVRCVNGDQELYVTTLLPAAPSSRTIVDETCCGANPTPGAAQFRVEINDLPGNLYSYTLHVLQAKDAATQPSTASVVDSKPSDPNSGTLTVTVDPTHSIVFQKGTTSMGGSVTIGGTTTNLRSDVQPIAITDAGAVWGP